MICDYDGNAIVIVIKAKMMTVSAMFVIVINISIIFAVRTLMMILVDLLTSI